MPAIANAVSLPSSRPSRVVVEAVAPVVDGGAFPAKATVGEPVTVSADVFTDGHDRAAAALAYRWGGEAWQETPMVPLGNDRFQATFVPDRLGRWQFQIIGWLDHLGTWRHGMELKLSAGVDVAVDLQIGLRLIARALERATGDDAAALEDLRDRLEAGDTRLLGRLPSEDEPHHLDGHVPDLEDVEPETQGPDLEALFWRTGVREPTAELARPLEVEVDPERARFSAWYEFFPRSTLAPATGHGTLVDAMDRLDYVAAMGFDVLYLPPVHPIGTTQRKGRNNTTTPTSDDTGSPWAIGAPDGGHTSVHPQLGTVDDVAKLAAACRDRRIELALDLAFQCTPDHPWVNEHPEWFAHRPDGTIQYAENPPKKYQDIYPLDFESADWQGLWTALADVIRFWIDIGVTIFRVDNPHTKAFAFWEWAIAAIRREHPEAIFLAEAFTRPRVMERLAKIGFNQSYTYFTWRQSSWELRHVLRGPRPTHRRLLPAQRLAQHARHPHRAAADRWADDVRQPGDPRRHAVTGVGRVRPGVRVDGAPSDARSGPRSTSTPRSTSCASGTCIAPTASPPCSGGSTASATSSRRSPTCGRCASTTPTTPPCCATRRPIRAASAHPCWWSSTSTPTTASTPTSTSTCSRSGCPTGRPTTSSTS